MTSTSHDPLIAAHETALEQVAALTLTRADIVGATEGANADDEHDPEGATIAFERQQVAALLEQAKSSLSSVEAALAARDSGTYGTCDRCGAEIGAERLEARPSATTCIGCAHRYAGRQQDCR